MTVESTPVDAEPVAVRSTRVPAAPLVLTEAGFGFLTGDEIDKIPGLSAAVENVPALSVQVGPERDLAAAKLESGAVVRLNSGGTEAETLDTRAGLVDPTSTGRRQCGASRGRPRRAARLPARRRRGGGGRRMERCDRDRGHGALARRHAHRRRRERRRPHRAVGRGRGAQ